MHHTPLLVAVCAPCFLAAAAFGQAGTGGSISHNNAMFTQGDAPTAITSAGPLADFRIGGAGNPNHLFQTWWWFRVQGDNREIPLTNASNPSWSGSTGSLEYNALQATHGSMIQTYRVVGFGSGGALLEGLTIINTTSQTLRWDVFHYLDADMGGSASGDSAMQIGANHMQIADGMWSATYEGSGRYQVGGFPAIRNLLTNTQIDNLDGTGLPFGPGDFSGAWQWTVTLAPGQATTITTSVTIVPTPGAGALLAMGGLLAMRRRR
jgi:hypothetical protein